VVELLNGSGDGPLAGWVIVIAHGVTLIGRPAGVHDLSPVYQLECGMQVVQPDPIQRPQLMTARRVVPVLTFPTITILSVPPDAIVVSVDTLSTKSRKQLAKSIASCDALIVAMRAEDADISVVPAGMRIP
jgi:hypothetical protein